MKFSHLPKAAYWLKYSLQPCLCSTIRLGPRWTSSIWMAIMQLCPSHSFQISICFLSCSFTETWKGKMTFISHSKLYHVYHNPFPSWLGEINSCLLPWCAEEVHLLLLFWSRCKAWALTHCLFPRGSASQRRYFSSWKIASSALWMQTLLPLDLLSKRVCCSVNAVPNLTVASHV